MKRAPAKTKTCPCGRTAVGYTTGTWTCQRCKDWDAMIYGSAESRNVSGIRRFLGRGDEPVPEAAEVFA